MDEYYQKYAKPLGKLSIYDLTNNLKTWKNNLQEELDGILYLKDNLNLSNISSKIIIFIFIEIDSSSKTKFIEIIKKLESLILSELDSIAKFNSEVFLCLIQHFGTRSLTLSDKKCGGQGLKVNYSEIVG